MTDDYTPTTEEVRDAYRRSRYYLGRSGGPEFDRWLAQHDEQVKYAAQAQWEQSAGYEVVTDAEGERIIRAKRSQPIEVTDAMVEAVVNEIRRYIYPNAKWIDDAARAALTAALNTMKEDNQ